MRGRAASRFASDPDLAAIAPVKAAPRAELPEDVAAVRLPKGWALLSRRAFRVEWSGRDLLSGDSFPVHVHVNWTIRWAEEDPASLARHFAGELGEWRASDLLAPISESLAHAVRRWVGGSLARTLMDTTPADAARALRRQIEREGLPPACPVRCLGAEGIAIEVPALRDLERAAAAEAVRAAAAELAIRGMRAHWILVEEAEQLAARRETTRREPFAPRPVGVLLAIGTRVLVVEGARLAREVDLASNGLGGLRSVRSLPDGAAIAGAQGGVIFFAGGLDSDPSRYPFPEPTRSGRGANAAILDGDRILATHGEHGLVAWRREEEDAPGRVLLAPARGEAMRGLALWGGAVVFAAGERVFELAPGSDRPRPLARLSGEVTALAAGRGLLAAGTRAGCVAVFEGDKGGRGAPRTVHAGPGPVLGLAIAGWSGSPRLLVGGGSPRVAALDPDGTLLASYPAASPVGLVAAGRSGVWGLSTDRRALYTWGLAETPPLVWTCGHAVSDLAVHQESRSPSEKKPCPAGV